MSVTKLVSGDVEKLVHMDDVSQNFIRGQGEVVIAVANAVRSQRARLPGGSQPIASFFMLSLTGTDLIVLSKIFAGFLFLFEHATIRFDMSEF